MATVVTRALLTDEKVHCSWRELVLPQIKQCEKKCFPSNEALNFELELKKRNVHLVVILHDDFLSSKRQQLVGYLLFSHPKAENVILLHKLCVVKDYRRQGIAKLALQREMERLKRQHSCIRLWVHKENTAATELYKSLGFKIVKEIEDYYGPGRAGAQMSLSPLQS